MLTWQLLSIRSGLASKKSAPDPVDLIFRTRNTKKPRGSLYPPPPSFSLWTTNGRYLVQRGWIELLSHQNQQRDPQEYRIKLIERVPLLLLAPHNMHLLQRRPLRLRRRLQRSRRCLFTHLRRRVLMLHRCVRVRSVVSLQVALEAGVVVGPLSCLVLVDTDDLGFYG